MRLRKGDLLAGNRYDLMIGQRLGEGTSGVTYVAKVVTHAPGSPLKRNQRVVIKAPQVGSSMPNEEMLGRLKDLFERGLKEAGAKRFLEGLHCVAQVLDYGYCQKLTNGKAAPDKILAVIQEYIDGLPLNEYLDQKYGNGRAQSFTGLPTEDDFFMLATRIVSAVRAVHQRQVVHGDIWQENVMLRKGSHEPVLIDFGQAAFIAVGLGKNTGPRGTFVAPEGNTTISADIFSLGWLLLFLATGEDRRKKRENGTSEAIRPPEILRRIGDVEGLKAAVVKRMQKRNPELYRENCGIADIIARCLRKDLRRRTRNTAALLRDLVLFDADAPTLHGTGALVKQIQNLENQNPLIAALIGGSIMNLTDQLADLRLGVLDLHDDFVVGLTQVVSLLGEGDQYLTVSTPRFWHDGNLGIQGRFLSANRQAVLRHNATIKRLFLLTRSDLEKEPHLSAIIDAQLEIAKDLESARQKDAGNIGVCTLSFLIVTDEQRREMIRRGSNFGVLIKGDKKLLLSIGYDDKADRIGRIQFRSDRKLTQYYVNKFNDLCARPKTRPLTEFHAWMRKHIKESGKAR